MTSQLRMSPRGEPWSPGPSPPPGTRQPGPLLATDGEVGGTEVSGDSEGQGAHGPWSSQTPRTGSAHSRRSYALGVGSRRAPGLLLLGMSATSPRALLLFRGDGPGPGQRCLALVSQDFFIFKCSNFLNFSKQNSTWKQCSFLWRWVGGKGWSDSAARAGGYGASRGCEAQPGAESIVFE